MSVPVLAEIVEVLRRPELTRRFKSLQGLDLTEIFSIVQQAGVVQVGEVPAVSRDSKDDKFLATAVAGRASYVVS